MIRCIHLWTGKDQQSHFEEGHIVLDPGVRGDVLTGKLGTVSVSFEETRSGGTFAWHTAPARQLVITLSGTLDFQTREGRHFRLGPGDILFAEDTAGSGHSWKLVDEQPWRQAYVILAPNALVPFEPSPASA
ncbi:MAG: AraC family ligand binding domain-containing protein [Alphaproteobacteria bacterium]|nr:AraC family ligand binding domain-containing protein [Alphaproteobacteria bacterium]MBV8407676.1 AraC family ligand binding domain-containing protein [Alphaproteobacteria bacterium]